jgi:hypothetical protein
MCNPRRVKVRASRRLSQAWQAEIERTVTLTDTVTGEARIVEPVGQGLAPPVRERLREILAADDDWRETPDGLRRDVPDGYLLYRPDTGELEIVATVHAEISAEGTAQRGRGGVVDAEREAQATASYYSDGFQGRNRAEAQAEGERRAGAEAQRRVEQEVRERVEAERRAAEQDLAARADEVEAEAQAQAGRLLDERRAALAGRMEAEAGQRARGMHEEVLRAFNGPLAEAYRDVLLERAARADARNLYYREENGVIEIQFEVG